MGMRTSSAGVPKRDPEFATGRFLAFLWCFVVFFRAFFVVVAVVSLIGAAVSAVLKPPNMAAAVVFCQWAVGSAVYALVLSQLKSVCCGLRSKKPFLFARYVKSLRIMGVALLALAILGMAFSLTASLLANKALPVFNLGFGLPGFPGPDVWDAVFNPGHELTIAPVVSLDIGLLVAVALLWVLSYAFEYGARLQAGPGPALRRRPGGTSSDPLVQPPSLCEEADEGPDDEHDEGVEDRVP